MKSNCLFGAIRLKFKFPKSKFRYTWYIRRQIFPHFYVEVDSKYSIDFWPINEELNAKNQIFYEGGYYIQKNHFKKGINSNK